MRVHAEWLAVKPWQFDHKHKQLCSKESGCVSLTLVSPEPDVTTNPCNGLRLCTGEAATGCTCIKLPVSTGHAMCDTCVQRVSGENILEVQT